MKTADKYKWAVGQSPPPLEPHSRVKHELLQEYVGRYIRTLLANPRREQLIWTLVDGFAGGGEYLGDDGSCVKGSPLLLIDRCRETEALINLERTKPVALDAHYYFVEREPATTAYLNSTLDAQGYRATLGNRLHVVQGTFEAHCDAIVDRVKVRSGGERALFVLDQYGFKDVPLPLIKSIFERIENPEVILTFHVDSLLTYLANNDSSRQSMKRLGLESSIDWKNLEQLKANSRWKEVIQRELSSSILEQSGAAFMTLFFIRPMGATPWSYWLVHLSRTYRAREVMMQVHWELGNQFAHAMEPGLFTVGYAANADPAASGQGQIPLGQEYEFNQVLETQAIKQLEVVLPRQIYQCDQPIRFIDLAARIANSTTAHEDLLRKALSPAIEVGELLVRGPNGERRTRGSSVRSQDTLSPAKQQSLFLPHDWSARRSNGVDDE